MSEQKIIGRNLGAKSCYENNLNIDESYQTDFEYCRKLQKDVDVYISTVYC